MDMLRFPFALDDNMSAPAERMERRLANLSKKLELADSKFADMDRTMKAMGAGGAAAGADALSKMDDVLRKTRSEAIDAARAIDGLKRSQVEAASASDRFNKSFGGRLSVSRGSRGAPAWMQGIGTSAEGRRAHIGPSVMLDKVMHADVAAMKAAEAPKVPKTSMFGGGILGTSFMAEAMPALFVGQQLVGMAESVGSAFLDAGIGISKYAIGQAAFKKSSLASLEVMTGSKAEAQDLFKYMQDLADVTPMTDKEVISNMKQLMVGGLDKKEARTLMVAMSDVESASGVKGAGAGILMQVNQAIARGKFETQDLKILAEHGVNLGHIYDQAAKLTGKTAAQIHRDGLDARTGIKAIENTIRQDMDKGGLLGTITKKISDSNLDVQLSTLESRFGRLFGDVDFSPVVDALKNLNTVLDTNSETGKKFHAVMDATFGKLFKDLFGDYTGANGLKKLEADMEGVVQTVKELASGFVELGKAMKGASGAGAVALGGPSEKHTAGENAWGIGLKLLQLGFKAEYDPQGAYGDAALLGIKGAAVSRPTSASAGFWDNLSETQKADAIGAEHRAAGGLVDRPTLALVGEAGPEMIIPLRNMPSGGGGGGLPAMLGGMHAEVHVTVHANGEASEGMTQAVVREVREALPSALQSAFEQMAMQSGVA